jgi:protein SCO1/2
LTGRIIKFLALAVASVAFALVLGWWQVDGPGAASEPDRRPLPLGAMDFVMTDDRGQSVGPETLAGRPSLVFFGFTYCPDVCPTTLSDISGWLDELGPEAERLNAVLITVDPERDTVPALAEYVSYFHPQIRAWRGEPAELAKAAEGFRARYAKVSTEDGYRMDHTAGVFLFRADGSFAGTIDYHEPREFAAPKIRRAMEEIQKGDT